MQVLQNHSNVCAYLVVLEIDLVLGSVFRNKVGSLAFHSNEGYVHNNFPAYKKCKIQSQG